MAKQKNIKLNPIMEAVSQELVIEFTNLGFGIGHTILELAKKIKPELKELKINKQLKSIDVYFATNLSQTFATQTFIKYIKNYSKKFNA